LTFDDGPHPENTPVILNILKEHGVKATFFVVGQEVERHPELVRRIFIEGHAVAGHSWSHRRLSQFAFQGAWEEFSRTKKAIREASGARTNLYRPPFGWVTLPMLAYAVAGRMKLILWSVDSDDDRTGSKSAVLAKGRKARIGDIVLFHDDNDAILKALPELLNEWRAQGFETGVLGEDEGV
jgi:peptidoglycan/xylan/chitin deacetylase (PgdA/CDA1 family)